MQAFWSCKTRFRREKNRRSSVGSVDQFSHFIDHDVKTLRFIPHYRMALAKAVQQIPYRTPECFLLLEELLSLHDQRRSQEETSSHFTLSCAVRSPENTRLENVADCRDITDRHSSYSSLDLLFPVGSHCF